MSHSEAGGKLYQQRDRKKRGFRVRFHALPTTPLQWRGEGEGDGTNSAMDVGRPLIPPSLASKFLPGEREEGLLPAVYYTTYTSLLPLLILREREKLFFLLFCSLRRFCCFFWKRLLLINSEVGANSGSSRFPPRQENFNIHIRCRGKRRWRKSCKKRKSPISESIINGYFFLQTSAVPDCKKA